MFAWSGAGVWLIAVGRLKAGPEAELFQRYNGRLRPDLQVIEIPEATGAALEIKRREAALILARIPPDALTVALDMDAPSLGSVELSRHFESWRASGRKVHFIIGGAEGLDRSVTGQCDHILSLGPLTWPHMLVRVMLAEQLYRAQSILQNHPYHRAGRP